MMAAMTDWRPTIVELSAAEVENELDGLAALLHACVHAGASVNFVLPFAMAEAAAFWRGRVLPEVRAGTRHVLAARLDCGIAGSVQLVPAPQPNQPHRADVAKLLVHPDARRRGLGRALMTALEALARREGRRLLTLDTRTGDAAEPLYAALGFVAAGTILDYSLDVTGTRLETTTLMYKAL
jgi:GNAT superfamily N-acetyltransferase